MDDVLGGGLLAGACCGIFGGVLGGVLGPLLVVWLMPAKRCPDCDAALPKFRNNWAPRQAVWRCPECDCLVDRKGNPVEDDDARW